MWEQYRSYVIGALIGLLGGGSVAGIGERAYHTYSWAGAVNNQAKAGAEAYGFLVQPVLGSDGKPVGYRKDGQPYTRADLLALLIESAVTNQRDAANRDSASDR